jgi:hypothetical protein
VAIIQHLLERWGFAKLARYGLVLSPEGRILSIHSNVLDDGTGGRIVGWREDDPMVAELPTWPAVRAGTRPEDSSPRAALATPVMTVDSVSAQISTAASESVMPVAVAPTPPVDEDDWEWTIALARARVAAEEAAEQTAAGPPPSSPAKIRSEPIAPHPEALPSALPGGAVDDAASARVEARPIMTSPNITAAPPSGRSRADVPSTVIPVPALPRVQNTAKAGRLEPVVRTISTPVPPAAPGSAKGTRPADPTATSRIAPGLSDNAERKLSAGDRTQPEGAMPPAARAVQLPSVKRRMARRG